MRKIVLLIIVFWNLENFFDYYDGGMSQSDAEFSPAGARHWTADRFYAKCSAIAKTIYYISSEKDGRMPDIFCMAEVENLFVIKRLLERTNLGKLPYGIIHYDSDDARGIDVALIYRRDRMKVLSSRPCHIAELTTRDILLAQFVTDRGDSLAVLVNHHPSKYGGRTTAAREQAVSRLKFLCDSLEREGWHDRLAIGDFNEVPTDEIYLMMKDDYTNLAATLAEKGEGTIKFNGRWELIDQAFVSNHLSEKASMKVEYIPFLLTADRAHSGLKPLRTYTGPHYAGGVSDHCPISVTIDYLSE